MSASAITDPLVASSSEASGETKTFQRRSSGTRDELLTRVRELLEERGQRLTYISVKREILKNFTEKSFIRCKRRIQGMLEEYHQRRTPARPKKRTAVLSPRSAAAAAEKKSNGNGESSNNVGDSKRQRRTRGNTKGNPRLYFYELNEEVETSAEGNRFIKDDDL